MRSAPLIAGTGKWRTSTGRARMTALSRTRALENGLSTDDTRSPLWTGGRASGRRCALRHGSARNRRRRLINRTRPGLWSDHPPLRHNGLLRWRLGCDRRLLLYRGSRRRRRRRCNRSLGCRRNWRRRRQGCSRRLLCRRRHNHCRGRRRRFRHNDSRLFLHGRRRNRRRWFLHWRSNYGGLLRQHDHRRRRRFRHNDSRLFLHGRRRNRRRCYWLNWSFGRNDRRSGRNRRPGRHYRTVQLFLAFLELARDIARLVHLGEINLGLDLRGRSSLPRACRAGFGRKMPPDEIRFVVLNGRRMGLLFADANLR